MANSSPLPFDASEESEGTPWIRKYSGPVGLNTPVILVIDTVPAGKRLRLKKIFARCFFEGTLALKSDSQLIASTSTGPAKPNGDFVWAVDEYLPSMATVTLEFQVHRNLPRPTVQVDAYAQALVIN